MKVETNALKEAVWKVNPNTCRSSLASLLRQCTSSKSLPEGNHLHKHIQTLSLDSDTLIGNLLVHMYATFAALHQAEDSFQNIHRRNIYSWTIILSANAQNGHLQRAKWIHDRMPQRNAVSWNVLISAYAKQGHIQSALKCYESMNLEGEQPNDNTLLAVFDACGEGRSAFLPQATAAHETLSTDRSTILQIHMNSLVSMYGKCGSIARAKAVFDTLAEADVVTWNSMLMAYAQNGHVQEAQTTFERMPERSIVSYNSLITAYAQNGQASEALCVFEDMQGSDVDVNEATYIIVLDTCASNLLLEYGRRVHRHIRIHNMEDSVGLGSLLVNMYGKCNSLSEAEMVFKNVGEQTTVLWNSMISAYAQYSDKEKALELFLRMEIEGFEPDEVTFLAVLNSCMSLFQVRLVDSLMEKPKKTLFVETALVTTYSKWGALDESEGVFNEMQELTTASWNSMISAYLQHKCYLQAFKLFQRMESEGYSPNPITIAAVLEVCPGLPLKYGQDVHTALAWLDLEQDVMVKSALIRMYGRCREARLARLVFETVREPNAILCTSMLTAFSESGEVQNAEDVFQGMSRGSVVSWNAMVSAYALNGFDTKAAHTFLSMLVEGVTPDSFTFSILLSSCTKLQLVNFVRDLITEHSSDELVTSSLVKAYGRCGDLAMAEEVFREMQVLNPSSWNVIIAACVHNRSFNKSLEFFMSMLQQGVRPNLITFASVIDATSGLTDVSYLKLVHSIAWEVGYEYEKVISNALVHAYGQCGHPFAALTVFERMTIRDRVSWTSIVTAFRQGGYAEVAMDLFWRMTLEGFAPDYVTCTSVLLVLADRGKVETCVGCFRCMQDDYGVEPMAEHYACLVDMLGRAGQLNKAEELIGCMPYEPGYLTWMMLLGASKTHASLNHGERAARSVLAFENLTHQPYVLLCNVYRAAINYETST